MKKGLVKTEEDIALIRESGRILGAALQAAAARVRPGVTTAELNEIAEAEIKRMGGEPSFKGYGPARNKFPAGLCTSINEVVVHGVPDDTKLKDGDIVGLDLGVRYKGYFTDAAVTLPVGNVSHEARTLLRTTSDALEEAIRAARAGNHIGDIGHAMQVVAESAGFNVVRQLIGHGVGYAVHEAPEVPCFGKPGQGMKLVPGMVLAIEPMVTVGGWHVTNGSGEWPVRTEDGSLAAHFEHTVVITEGEAEVVTRLISPSLA